jgi:hypothetical protein
MKHKTSTRQSAPKNFAKAAEQFFTEAQKNIDTNKYKEFAYRIVDKIEAEKIRKKTGLNLEGYVHKITNMDIRHIYKEHGNQKIESNRGQIAIIKRDITLIPEITQKYTSIELSQEKAKSGNRRVLVYRKKFSNEYYYLETIGGKKTKDLRPKTLWLKNG